MPYIDPADYPTPSDLAEPVPLHFIVYGRPQPAGSKRAFPVRRASGALGVSVTDDNPQSRDWKNAVASAAVDARPRFFGPDDGGDLLDGPLVLQIRFTFARPKSHFGTGRNAGVVKPGAPEAHTVRPDCTKLLRAVEDALTGVLWRDDAQVVAQDVRKRYGPHDAAEVVIWPT